VKRAPLVVGATGVGLGLLFTFHTKPIHADAASSVGTGTTLPTAEGSGASTSTTQAPSTSSSGGSSTSTSPSSASSSRSATGGDLQYRYGDLQLRVTEQGTRISSIQIVSDQATDARSEEINSQALPTLQQQAMSAQSANIDGVSGATFTSEAYARALQSALDQLK
jgi:uncharacterized protein with FMN-binding domain